jgi:hypothetical protein
MNEEDYGAIAEMHKKYCTGPGRNKITISVVKYLHA